MIQFIYHLNKGGDFMESLTQIIEEINKIDNRFKRLLVLNQKQTAEVLGVSNSTLEGWRKNSLGPEYIKAGPGKSRVLYPKQKIAEYLANTIKTL